MKELFSPKTIQEMLKKYQIKPSVRLGQNFLIDQNILNKIIDSANITENDTILEVGPGIGTLTRELAKKAKRVVAVEKDKKMVEILQETLAGYSNIQVIQEDILVFLHAPWREKNYTVVANIPYYLTSHLIRTLLESQQQPKDIILMIQKEVAQRILAKPPHMNLLALSVQYYADPNIIYPVSRNCFWPSPKIDSTIIKITPKKITGSPQVTKWFFKIAKAGFAQKRKQLANNLSNALKIPRGTIDEILLSNGISPQQRAETLTMDNWEKLTISLKMDD